MIYRNYIILHVITTILYIYTIHTHTPRNPNAGKLAPRLITMSSGSTSQVLGRFESVQDVLVMCLVRMLSCGNRRS